jgi:hypothetical protein
MDLGALGDTPDPTNLFPADVSPINGVLLCYDSNKRETFAALEPLIRELRRPGILTLR